MRNYLIQFAILTFFSSTLAHGVCVNVRKANLRMGPSTNYEISWEVARYMPFKPVKKRDGWLKVQDLDGDYHWISSGLTTRKFYCAVVKVSRARLRTGPGTKYRPNKRYPMAEKYESFRLLKQKNGWALITDDYGDKMWISRKLIWVH